MAEDYSVQTIRDLEDLFDQQKILRPIRLRRYEQGAELTYDIKGVVPAKLGRVKLVVEKFIGGGYAGQVYKVKVLDIESSEGGVEGIQVGETYAMKILIPPSGFARLFRNMIYALAFQGPFSLQGNPAAARAGAIWQKFLRRGTKIRFDSERAVVDIHATFIDSALGSCGEISEWIDGRMWRFEVDDDLDARSRWKVGDPEDNIGSPEYRAKKTFMIRFVELMHEMGALELARQYEWATCKSQPNALKRLESDPSPSEGHVAVDFRAGLALLPFLPMCPADFKLIFKGIARGSWVQFDRGNLEKLENFIKNNPESLEDMSEAFEELKENERIYRDSLPDITHHHFRLLFSPKLWSSILKGSITNWRVRNHIDDEHSENLTKNRFLTLIFYLLGLIPFLGKFIRKIWGREDYKKHYARLFSNLSYFLRVGRARIAETLIRWHRAGRIDAERAQKLSRSPLRFYAHLPLSILPAKVHRFFSDRRFFLRSLDNIFARPLRLYFKAEVREKWLRETVVQGKNKGMLTEEEAAHITSQLKEPFIQKYLKSLAVHVCTAPVTQIVSVIVAIIYVRMRLSGFSHPDGLPLSRTRPIHGGSLGDKCGAHRACLWGERGVTGACSI
jgi:ABC-type maltose transport system permease subunit